VNARIGPSEAPRGRYPETTGLFLLNGNSALADVYFDASRFLPLLVEQIAGDQGSDGEHADNEVENVAIHGLVGPENNISIKLENG
jgi:hypothetical protein